MVGYWKKGRSKYDRSCFVDIRTTTPVKLTGFTILFSNFYFMLHFLSEIM